MVNNGSGGCGVFVALLLVFVVFGAGYLLAESNQVAVQNQIGERALEMSGETIATLVPQATQAAELRSEVARVQAEAAAAIAAQVNAENARIAAEAARKQAESAMAEAVAARSRAEGELALSSAARAKAENDLALANAARAQAESELALTAAARDEAVRNLEAAESSIKVAYEIYLDQQATIDRLQGERAANPMIPVSGDAQRPNGKLVFNYGLLPMLGVAMFGLVTGLVVMRLMTPSSSTAASAARMPTLQDDSRCTYVKMTREEARQYARWRKNG